MIIISDIQEIIFEIRIPTQGPLLQVMSPKEDGGGLNMTNGRNGYEASLNGSKEVKDKTNVEVYIFN